LNQTIARSKVAELIEEYLWRKLNTTKDRLPVQYLDETQLQNLLESSLDYEDQIYSNRTEEAPARKYGSSFFEAVQRK